MFEPLRHLLSENPQALVEDHRILGEKGGRLYGSRDAAAYAASGGVEYTPVQMAKSDVIDWGRGGRFSDSVKTGRAAAGSLDVSPSRAMQPLRSVLTRVADCLLCSNHCRGSRGVSLSRLPHLLPSALYQVIKGIASVLPVARVLFPRALPTTHRLQSGRLPYNSSSHISSSNSPERVAAVAFHPVIPWIAVAVEEGGIEPSARVIVYDVMEETVVCVLTHAFQMEVEVLLWKPCSRDVLAVGCRGGILLWSLSAGRATTQQHPGSDGGASSSSPAAYSADGAAWALFYRVDRGLLITSAAFNHMDGGLLACGSTVDTRLHILDVRQSPHLPTATFGCIQASIDGGVEQVLFSIDDSFLLSAISDHASLVMTDLSKSGYQTTVVPTPAPVQQLIEASGFSSASSSFYFVSFKRVEGLLLIRISPSIGIEVISTISTGIFRGVGGFVRQIACSRRRLWIAMETGHVVVCRYGERDQRMTLLPVGVAALQAVELSNFDGCTAGSLVAAVEADGGISFIPSYHF